ncbi:MAG TPA: aminotransferase class V-fold PLP-dependent enzyme [Vicinamibacteria bacterium]|nr:aminotransferase class V-fold PLP-dependent enzyme [Vicinamibacteria bacterium]
MTRETSRRSFLAEMAAAAAVVPAAFRGEEALAGKLDGEAYWGLVRAQFSFTDQKVPMNAANLCPSPRAVAERVTELTADIDRDCSFQNRGKFAELLESSRSKVAGQLGVSPEEIALVRNTSEANNTINNGLSLQAGDEVVLWEQNHPTNNVAWDVRARRYGLSVVRVSTPKAPKNAKDLVDPFVQAFTPKTKVLAITHVSNVSGVRLPARELVAAAHARGIYVHLDGAQSWGALDVDLKEIACDSYSASAHKWFLGPKEAGILYVKEENISRIWPNIVAPGWGSDADPDVKGARKFESLGQRDDACLASIATAVDFHRAIGHERVEARVVELATALKQGLAAEGFSLVTPLDAELSGGVCILEVPSKKGHEVVDRLYAEHGIAAAATGGLRLCPHVYNTMEHVERAVAGVLALRSEIG